MPAGDFSAATVQQSTLKMSRLWQEGATKNIFNTPTDTAKAVLQGQGMVEIPNIINGICVGTRIYHLTDTNAVGPSYSGDVATSTLGCDLPAGKEGEAVSQEYSPDLLIHDDREIDENLCANEIQFQEKLAFETAMAMANVRYGLNEKAITHLDASAQAPVAGSTDYTVTGNEIAVPPDDFGPDLIASIYRMAQINQTDMTHIHSGSNFFERHFNATYNALNDNQRDQIAKYGAIGDMTWDLRRLDQKLGEAATFVYDPQMLGFFNYKGAGRLTYNAQLVDPQLGVWSWLQDDPELMYRRIVRSESGALSVSMEPVTYIVEYQKNCVGRDAFKDRLNNSKLVVRFVGGYTNAPQGAAGETRVFKIVKTNPA